MDLAFTERDRPGERSGIDDRKIAPKRRQGRGLRAVALAEPGARIEVSALSEGLRARAHAAAHLSPLKLDVRHFERAQIARALRLHDGNRTQAARALGLTRRGLLKKMRRLGLAAGPAGG